MLYDVPTSRDGCDCKTWQSHEPESQSYKKWFLSSYLPILPPESILSAHHRILLSYQLLILSFYHRIITLSPYHPIILSYLPIIQSSYQPYPDILSYHLTLSYHSFILSYHRVIELLHPIILSDPIQSSPMLSSYPTCQSSYLINISSFLSCHPVLPSHRLSYSILTHPDPIIVQPYPVIQPS